VRSPADGLQVPAQAVLFMLTVSPGRFRLTASDAFGATGETSERANIQSFSDMRGTAGRLAAALG
jgi:hypothetical protein